MADLVTTFGSVDPEPRVAALEGEVREQARRISVLERDVATLLRRVDGLAAANARLAAGLR